MRTTVDISDPLLHKAKQLAQSERTTLRALIEEGLRQILGNRPMKNHKPYELPDLSFGGNGLRHGVDPNDWAAIKRLSRERSAPSP